MSCGDVVVASLVPGTDKLSEKVNRLEEALAAKTRDLRILRILNAIMWVVLILTGWVMWDLLQSVKLKEYVGSIKQIEDEARASLKRPMTYPGEDAYLHMRVAYALLQQGKTDEAYAAYEVAKSVDAQKTSECQDTLEFATVAYRKGDLDGAKKFLEEIISFDPRVPQPYCTYAMLLSMSAEDSFRDGKRAVALALRGVELANEQQKRSALTVLAAAYAETGDFEKAVATQTAAMALTDGSNGADEKVILQKMAYRLRQLEAHVPVRWWPRNLFSAD